jgi:phosphatidylglycerophosphate synthase
MFEMSPQLSQTPLLGRVLVAQMAGLAAAVAMSVVVETLVPTTPAYVVKAALVFAVIALVTTFYVNDGHPFRSFGPANYVTTFRAALVAMAAALIGEAPVDAIAWAAAGIGAATTALDGVDGWLARRTSMASVFGARYDMELDALLIMVLAVIAWQTGKAGPWVILAGAMRYLFVAAAYLWRWLDSPLPPSGRRKAVCVIQIVGLGLAVSPFVAATASTIVAAGTLALLTWSFGVDVLWLRRHGG